jgi:hypothetical protein
MGVCLNNIGNLLINSNLVEASRSFYKSALAMVMEENYFEDINELKQYFYNNK